MQEKKTALIAGASGIVGRGIAEHGVVAHHIQPRQRSAR